MKGMEGSRKRGADDRGSGGVEGRDFRYRVIWLVARYTRYQQHYKKSYVWCCCSRWKKLKMVRNFKVVQPFLLTGLCLILLDYYRSNFNFWFFIISLYQPSLTCSPRLLVLYIWQNLTILPVGKGSPIFDKCYFQQRPCWERYFDRHTRLCR